MHGYPWNILFFYKKKITSTFDPAYIFLILASSESKTILKRYKS